MIEEKERVEREEREHWAWCVEEVEGMLDGPWNPLGEARDARWVNPDEEETIPLLNEGTTNLLKD